MRRPRPCECETESCSTCAHVCRSECGYLSCVWLLGFSLRVCACVCVCRAHWLWVLYVATFVQTLSFCPLATFFTVQASKIPTDFVSWVDRTRAGPAQDNRVLYVLKKQQNTHWHTWLDTTDNGGSLCGSLSQWSSSENMAFSMFL